MNVQLITDLIAVILTLMVLSRIIGDHPVFRVTQYGFIGVSLGYAFVVAYHQVLRPALANIVSNLRVDPIVAAYYLAPLVFGILLLPRITRRQRFSWLANFPLGLIFGVGAALAMSGAMLGTLLPQLAGTVAVTTRVPLVSIAGQVVLGIGVIVVLSSFHFTVPTRPGLRRVARLSAAIGRWVLLITFGFFLAGALLTYLTALSDRLQFIVRWIEGLVSG